jgi:protein YIPF5/7
MTVLNPLSRIDERIMDDADLAGPIIFVFCFAMFLLLVCPLLLPVICTIWMADSVLSFLVQSGKSNFGYIYGVGLFGSLSIYTLLNLMSQQGIDAYRVSSVLGYCLLPMVNIGALSIIMTLEYIYLFFLLTWC